MKKLILLTMLIISSIILAEEKEFKTKYFRVVFDVNYEKEAIHLASFIDGRAEEQFEFFNFEPKQEITVVLRDKMDEENAFAVNKSIFLFPNVINTNYLEKTYDDWYSYVFTHELTHVILHRKIGGLIAKVPLMNYTIHQILQPSWYHEGLAVYTEVKFAEDKVSGRELSRRFDLEIRTAVLEGKFEGLKLANGFYMNENPYTHGYSFIKFYAETYGEDKLIEAVERATEHQIVQPFEAFVRVAGLGRDKELFEEWKSYLDEKYKKKDNIVDGKKLENIPIGMKLNLITRDKKLYYSDMQMDDTKEVKMGIYTYNFSTEEEEVLSDDAPVYGFDLTEDALYYSAIRYNPVDQNAFAETYRADLTKDEIEEDDNEEESLYIDDIRHLEIKRALFFAALDNDIAYVYRERGKQGMRTLNGEELISPNEDYLFQKLNFDNESGNLYFAATKLDKKVSYIYRLNIKSKEIKRVVKGYSPFVSGNTLYFENSLKGTFDIFSYDLKTNVITQFTNSEYGAFEPAVIDEELYFLNYVYGGKDINKLEKEEFYNKVIDENDFDEKESYETNEHIEIEKINSQDLEISEFKNNFSYESGLIMPGMLSLNFSDVFKEKNITVGLSSQLSAGNDFKDNDSDIYYGMGEEESLYSGAFADYMDSRWFAHIEGGEKTYGLVSYTHPLISEDKNATTYGEISIDSDKSSSLNIYRQTMGLIPIYGYKRTFDEEDSDLNELYAVSLIQLHYFWSAEDRAMTGFLNENAFVDFDDSETKLLRYNINSDRLILAKMPLEKRFAANLGNVSGTTSVQSYITSLDFNYLKWNNEQRLLYNAAVGFNGFFLTNFPMTVKAGYISEYDVEESEFSKDKSMAYMSYTFEL